MPIDDISKELFSLLAEVTLRGIIFVSALLCGCPLQYKCENIPPPPVIYKQLKFPSLMPTSDLCTLTFNNIRAIAPTSINWKCRLTGALRLQQYEIIEA